MQVLHARSETKADSSRPEKKSLVAAYGPVHSPHTPHSFHPRSTVHPLNCCRDLPAPASGSLTERRHAVLLCPTPSLPRAPLQLPCQHSHACEQARLPACEAILLGASGAVLIRSLRELPWHHASWPCAAPPPRACPPANSASPEAAPQPPRGCAACLTECRSRCSESSPNVRFSELLIATTKSEAAMPAVSRSRAPLSMRT